MGKKLPLLKDLKDKFQSTKDEFKVKRNNNKEEKLKQQEKRLNDLIKDKNIRGVELLESMKEYNPAGPYNGKQHKIYQKNRTELFEILTFLSQYSFEDYNELRERMLKYDPFSVLSTKVKEIEGAYKVIKEEQAATDAANNEVDTTEQTPTSRNLQVEEMETKLRIAEIEANLLEEENKKAKQQTLLIEEQAKQQKLKIEAELALVKQQLELEQLKSKFNKDSKEKEDEDKNNKDK